MVQVVHLIKCFSVAAASPDIAAENRITPRREHCDGIGTGRSVAGYRHHHVPAETGSEYPCGYYKYQKVTDLCTTR